MPGQEVAAPLPGPRRFIVVAALAATAAVAAAGVVVSGVVLRVTDVPAATVPPLFWAALLFGLATTITGLWLRATRFAFLLRRSGIRLPLWPVMTSYLAGFALLLVPLFVGEIAIRAWLLRRHGVPVASPIALGIWERVADLAAILTIGGVFSIVRDPANPAGWIEVAVAASLLAAPLRRGLASAMARAVDWPLQRLAPRSDRLPPQTAAGVSTLRAWIVTWAVSIVIWFMPGLGFWAIVSAAGGDLPLTAALASLARSELLAAIVLAPAGVAVVGTSLVFQLIALGVPEPISGLAVLGLRLTSGGAALTFGAVMLWLAWRTRPAHDDHFDVIAHAYDVQIPEARRRALLDRKMSLIVANLPTGARCGADAGCGQGAAVAWLRERGYGVIGVDTSAGQVASAERRFGPGTARLGSVLSLPFADASLDFIYTVNVLHHLPDETAQRAAFTELARVVRPGGRVFVHEINTTNPLFRIYMGYVFPLLNAIDEGTERWIRPALLPRLADGNLLATEYFTFFPEFMPQALATRLRPVEAWLEAGRLRRWSAHYMAVIERPFNST
jgi:SAM-dependent methyltransferase/uncharacterized membrane protein YbhN (UPF0104 family)